MLFDPDCTADVVSVEELGQLELDVVIRFGWAEDVLFLELFTVGLLG